MVVYFYSLFFLGVQLLFCIMGGKRKKEKSDKFFLASSPIEGISLKSLADSLSLVLQTVKEMGDRLLDLQNNPLDIENIINNSIGSRNQMNNDYNSAFKSKYVSHLNGSASSKRDDIFSVFHFNIQGLCSSFGELKRIVSDVTPDVIGLCETFLDSKRISF